MSKAPSAFTTSSLITASRITRNPTEAFRLAPDAIAVKNDNINSYQKGLLYELNRFPGSTIFAYVPEGPAREEVLMHVEARAREFERETKKPLHQVHGYISVTVYLSNLRELFRCADIQAGKPLWGLSTEIAAGPTPATVDALRADIPAMLEELKDPEEAIRFGLRVYEAVYFKMFLQDRQDGKDLRPWLEELINDMQDAIADNAA